MRKIIAKALRFLRIIRFDFLTKSVGHQPISDEITVGELLVVENDGIQKWACLKCPGGCGAKIALSLNPVRRPRWHIARDCFDRPTISPSIHQQNACGCHFWIKNGEVAWCADGRPKQLDKGEVR